MSVRVRAPAVAGAFYPGRARELENTINRLFGQVEHIPVDGEVVGLISPHAGYIYSGQTAAYAYDLVRDESFDLVVIISPAHFAPMGRFAVIRADAYETPLGQVPIDQAMVDKLGEHVPVNRVDYDGDEHSLEVQLPFLQVALRSFALLPIMVRALSLDAGVELGTALSEVLQDSKALIVASTDMHHISDYHAVVRRDRVVIDALASADMERIREALSPPDCSVCGRVAVYAMLAAARALGADQVQVLHHANSADVSGFDLPRPYFVGYLAAAAYKSR